MTAAYMISYDLRKVRNYDALIEELRDWDCISPLESLWLGYLKGDSGTIRDLLRKHVDSDDGIVVCEIKPTHDWATYKANDKAGDWFRKHLGG